MSHGYVLYSSYGDSCETNAISVVIYSYRREASRCSFRQTGQCEGLQSWSEQQVTGFTLFYY